MNENAIHIGNIKSQSIGGEVKGEYVSLNNEDYFKIVNSQAMRPFFMSIVSDSNHWMFISSNGALTAGRKNSESSLFPYYTDDKITESLEITGSKTLIRAKKNGTEQLWEPFSERYEGIYDIGRNLYKNVYGNKIIFEEINKDLGLTFRYQWNSSNIYGFVREASLINDSSDEVRIELLDGLQNILPFGVNTDLQNVRSNLVDAYKRSELSKESGIGIYALSAIIVDKAEPSEALKATIAWSVGLEAPKYLLSSRQIQNFRDGSDVVEEHDIKAEKGAYFLNTNFNLQGNSQKDWTIVANVNQTVSQIVEISEKLKDSRAIEKELAQDIELGTHNLIHLTAAADGLQLTEDKLRCARHYSNVLYNIMRGGIFDNNYDIENWDFSSYMKKANKKIFESYKDSIEELPEIFTLLDLKKLAQGIDNPDFKRLCGEYMPLKFSRRHGDPSRPWNKFSINTRSEVDGSKILDYEGNWRDIFQNWEALAHSYPEFIDSMIFKFLNATTFEGYNPYRVTKGGFDWEIIEPDDPWSYIGYWGDHQIIYLLKFLEFINDYYPSKLGTYFNQQIFAYANVPYKIKSYEDTLQNPKDTIDFDDDLDKEIRERRDQNGADGALLTDQSSDIYRVNMMEKLLATVLAKCSNFIPEGGIWLNTQRPEWNDANNALVGNGVSMVTLYYLRRFLKFMGDLLDKSDFTETEISIELNQFFKAVKDTFEAHQSLLESRISDTDRKKILDGLGQAGSQYREQIYAKSFSGSKSSLHKDDIKAFIEAALGFMEHSIDANRREDGMYHAYNLMSVENKNEVSISYLSEMLEGQVAVLSSGYLGVDQCLGVLDGMKNSALFRDDQYSYLLYPDKELPGFMLKNSIPAEGIENSQLLRKLVDDENLSIVEKDVQGNFHFNGSFNNAGDLAEALSSLSDSTYSELAEKEREYILELFEQVFDHKSFTGRSGTFFGYEGLGSIYWHMVSKLLLAVEECILSADNSDADPALIGSLIDHYFEINAGIGMHKPPKLYGAFPIDPYSHTPATKGAQQPGMTGQVKEDILSRIGELGISVKNGIIGFNPFIFNRSEFLENGSSFKYRNLSGGIEELVLEKDSLCFTYGQIPVVYKKGTKTGLTVSFHNAPDFVSDHMQLNSEISQSIFERRGEVQKIVVMIV